MDEFFQQMMAGDPLSWRTALPRCRQERDHAAGMHHLALGQSPLRVGVRALV